MGATVITGAASGIGRATARRLSATGQTLALLDRSPEPLAAAAAECVGVAQMPAAYPCDVTDGAAVQSTIKEVASRFDGVDNLVLAAGIGRYAPFLETTMEEWSGFLDVNVLGIVRCIRAALPYMVAAGTGRIIILGSRRGMEPGRETAAYSATKAALHGIAGALAQEVGPKGVHVTLLCPGGVRSNFRNIPGETKDERWLEADDIAEAIAYVLAQPPKAWIRQMDLLPLGF
jgi:NADP-dependent 3-hydroxy acid dehydrogenase YdfG